MHLAGMELWVMPIETFKMNALVHLVIHLTVLCDTFLLVFTLCMHALDLLNDDLTVTLWLYKCIVLWHELSISDLPLSMLFYLSQSAKYASDRLIRILQTFRFVEYFEALALIIVSRCDKNFVLLSCLTIPLYFNSLCYMYKLSVKMHL